MAETTGTFGYRMSVLTAFAKMTIRRWRRTALLAVACCFVLIGCSSNATEPATSGLVNGSAADSLDDTTDIAPLIEEPALETSSTTSSRAPSTTVAPTTLPSTTTTTITSFQEVFLAPNTGDPGASLQGPVATDLDEALELLAPGGTIRLAPGVHKPIALEDYVGNAAAPLRIVAMDGAVIHAAALNIDAAVRIKGSSHVVLQNLQLEHALWGLVIEGSRGVALFDSTVSDIGQEAIRVRDGSSQIRIERNSVFNTGMRSDIEHQSGEGIYIGTGTPSGVDAVDDIRIVDNDIFQTSDEAIDIKAAATNIVIANNRVSDISTGTSGAVVVHLDATPDAEDPNVIIERNVIRNVRRTSPYRDGNCIVAAATVTIVNNVLHDCEHRGIYLRGEAGTAIIQHNTLIKAGDVGGIVNEHATFTVLDQNNLGVAGESNHLLDERVDLVDPSAQDYRVAQGGVLNTAPFIGVVHDFTGAERALSEVTYGAFEYLESIGP